MMLDVGNDARAMFARCLGDVQEMLGVEPPSAVQPPSAEQKVGVKVGARGGGGGEV